MPITIQAQKEGMTSLRGQGSNPLKRMVTIRIGSPLPSTTDQSYKTLFSPLPTTKVELSSASSSTSLSDSESSTTSSTSQTSSPAFPPSTAKYLIEMAIQQDEFDLFNGKLLKTGDDVLTPQYQAIEETPKKRKTSQVSNDSFSCSFFPIEKEDHTTARVSLSLSPGGSHQTSSPSSITQADVGSQEVRNKRKVSEVSSSSNQHTSSSASPPSTSTQYTSSSISSSNTIETISPPASNTIQPPTTLSSSSFTTTNPSQHI